MTTSRYAPLTAYLRKSGRAEIPMTFDDIEEVIGAKLPPSASTHRAWFSNHPTSNPMTRAWLAAGYRSADVDMANRKLLFRKVAADEPSPAGVNTNMRDLRTEGRARLDGFDARLRAIEVGFGKIDQRIGTIERVVLPAPGDVLRRRAAQGVRSDVNGGTTDLERFYSLLDELRLRLGGCRRLANCNGRMEWPQRGVYFFFEDGEVRSSSDDGVLRVVRVGTHALRPPKRGSGTSLWSRLAQHRGVGNGGGNHRGSIFRLLVGTALMQRDSGLAVESWGQGNTAPRAVREGEHALECRVSDLIRQMPLLWLEVSDEPGPNSLRGVIERNAIALLSNAAYQAAHPASHAWLGRDCSRESVQRCGLWNTHYTNETYDPGFLDVLERLVSRI